MYWRNSREKLVIKEIQSEMYIETADFILLVIKPRRKPYGIK
jgi:hypothetical protein